MESLHDFTIVHRGHEPISPGRERLRRALIFIAPKRFQGSTESRPTVRFMESLHLFCARIGTMNHAESPSPALRAPSPPSGGEGWGEGVRFMESWQLRKQKGALPGEGRLLRKQLLPTQAQETRGLSD